METVAHDASAGRLLRAIAIGNAAAVAIAAVLDAGDQRVLGQLGSSGIMTPVATRHFGLMCCVSEIRVDEKGLC